MRTLVCALVLLPAASAARDDASPPPHLDLAAAVAEALQRSDRMLDAADAVEHADLAVRLARSTFRPRIVPNIQGAVGETDLANQTYRVDVFQKLPTGTDLRGTVGASSFRNQLGTYYASDTTLQLSQPLLRGRGIALAKRQLRSAEDRRREAALQRTASEQRLTVDVAAAYYRIVSQDRLADVATKSLERARRLLDATQAKLEIGKVSQLDVARAQQLVAQAEGQLLDARGAVEDAKDSLRLLLGRDDGTDFEVADEIPADVEPLTEEAAVATALERRPELEAARAGVAQAELSVKHAKNELLPQLDLGVALTRRESGDTLRGSLGFDRFRFATFFNVSVPVDRTPQEVEHSQALIERDRRLREVRAFERQVASEARRALRQQERLVKSLRNADTALAFARTELEVAEMRYERGLSSSLDVVTAQANLLAAEGRRITTLAELAVGRLHLRATLGVLDPRSDVAEVPPAP